MPMDHSDYAPGDPALEDGLYEALNVSGSPSGVMHHVRQGERLPPLPLRQMWHQVRLGLAVTDID